MNLRDSWCCIRLKILLDLLPDVIAVILEHEQLKSVIDESILYTRKSD